MLVAEQEQQDWQKRGMGGLVSNVDPATGATVTISVTGLGGKKEIAVHTTKNTVVSPLRPRFGEVRRCQAEHACRNSIRRPAACPW